MRPSSLLRLTIFKKLPNSANYLEAYKVNSLQKIVEESALNQKKRLTVMFTVLVEPISVMENKRTKIESRKT